MFEQYPRRHERSQNGTQAARPFSSFGMERGGTTRHSPPDPAETLRRLAVCNVSSRPVAAQHVRPPVTKGRAKKKGAGKSEPLTAAVPRMFLLVPFARCSDFAEETVTLILNACGEEELVGVSRHKAIAEGQSPKAVNGDGIALTTAKLTVERVALELEASDATVAEIAHQQVARKLPEVMRGKRQAPGRVERAARSKPLEEATVEVEDINKAAPWPLDVVVSLSVLHGEGDIQLAIDVLNAEGSETRVRRVRGNGGVGERIHEAEFPVIHFHHTVAKVGGINEVPRAVIAGGKTLVDGAQGKTVDSRRQGVIHGQERMSQINLRSPAADRAILGREQEQPLAGSRPVRNHEVGRAVENDTRGRA